ncbi:MAG: hypothetical protein IKU11_01190 [Clostridia bacterium]|nr:hypothetical protein [Clostridia bacterium]
MKTILPYLLCLLSLPLLGQFNSYNLPKATGKIVIDGKLDEPDWKQKPLISAFRPFNVINSEIPQTSVWMLQEEEALVIAVECMEEFPNALVTKAQHDGGIWNDDHVEFFFDTAGERKSCVQILVNAKGVVADGIIARHGEEPDWKWECGAEVKTSVQSDRWLLEMRIPFASFPSGSFEDTIYLLSILRLIKPTLLLPATTALGTIHPRGREMGILAGANVVMPNLSPLSVRKKYELYEGKIATGEESAQSVRLLAERMESIGYKVVTARGDAKQ